MKELQCDRCQDFYQSDWDDGTGEVTRDICRSCQADENSEGLIYDTDEV